MCATSLICQQKGWKLSFYQWDKEYKHRETSKPRIEITWSNVEKNTNSCANVAHFFSVLISNSFLSCREKSSFTSSSSQSSSHCWVTSLPFSLSSHSELYYMKIMTRCYTKIQQTNNSKVVLESYQDNRFSNKYIKRKRRT